jgi:tRNA-specific 2-thiouridylase
VLVAMSGGVDSSVAAALLVEEGHEVVGATLKLWGGPSDSGCCSVADVEDARRVADQLGIVHHVFNLTEEFEQSVVEPYVASHAAGRTPNPCVECNRHIKFDRLLTRAVRLGHDVLATGHHARVRRGTGTPRLLRGVDADKDQSYVLSMLSVAQLERVVLPVGEMTKAEVRSHARRLGLRTAGKPDSQDVCFIHGAEGRAGFLGRRLALHDAAVVDRRTGATAGTLPAMELVTVGQRRGIGRGDDGGRRYVVDVDVPARRVVVGGEGDVRSGWVELDPATVTWVDGPRLDGEEVVVQLSAHGAPVPGRLVQRADRVAVALGSPQRLVAPGQTVALYDASAPEVVVGSAIALRRSPAGAAITPEERPGEAEVSPGDLVR